MLLNLILLFQIKILSCFAFFMYYRFILKLLCQNKLKLLKHKLVFQ